MSRNWVVIENFPSYAVSEFGEVKRIVGGKGLSVGKILKPTLDTHGYIRYGLWKDGISSNRKAHRLVMDAFGPPAPSEDHEVAHIDGNPLNPHISNLKWVTRLENMSHTPMHGTYRKGADISSKLDDDSVRRIRLLNSQGVSGYKLAKEYQVCEATISNILNRRSWRHVSEDAPPLSERFSEIEKLELGWAGSGTLPPSSLAVEAAKMFDVIALPSGGVSLVWKSGGKSAEVTFDTFGRVTECKMSSY